MTSNAWPVTVDQGGMVHVEPSSAKERLLSIMIPVHNVQDTDTFSSSLAQVFRQVSQRDDVEIVVLDDASEDNTAASLVEQHCPSAQYVRHEEPLGLVGNFNECVRVASGRIVHILHQDDVILDDFYSTVLAPFVANPEFVGQSVCRFHYVDGNHSRIAESALLRQAPGVLEDWPAYLMQEQKVQFVASVISRECFETLGGFRTDLPFALDWELWHRISVHYPVWFSPHVRAHYRIHDASATGRMSCVDRLSDELRALSIMVQSAEHSYDDQFSALTNRCLDYWKRWVALVSQNRNLAAESLASFLAHGDRTLISDAKELILN